MDTGTGSPYKIIHRIWLDDPLPEEFAETGRIWQRLHPDWTLLDWRSSTDLPELHNRDLFDRAHEISPYDWKRFQSDLLRYELIEQFGGIYADTDSVPRINLEPLLRNRSCVFGYSPKHIGGVHPITQCFFAAEPDHSFIRRLVNTLPDAVNEHDHKPLSQSIGPWHVTRTYYAKISFRAGVHPLASHEMFGPGGWIHHYWNNRARKQGKGVW